VVTIPNALTGVRALGIPLFLWLVLIQERYGWAVLVLMVAGATDYFDGKLARALHQESRLGELMDPAVDRLYIISVLVAMYVTETVPVAILLLVAGRDLVLGAMLIVMKRKGIPPFTVTYLGKAATFNLLYALPLLLLTKNSSDALSTFSFVMGWAFAGWGIALYLYTGVSYARTGFRELKGR
jgi:cardiolipin synthase